MKRLRNSLLIGGAVLVAIAIGTVAWAFYSTTGSGSANASTATLAAPVITDLSSPIGSGQANIEWTTVASPGSGAIDGYYVQRFAGTTATGSPTNVCGTPSSLTTATSCTDTLAASGDYTYRVIAVFNSWTATSAPSTVNVLLDTTPPTAGAPIVTADTTFGSNPIFVTNEDLNLTDIASDTGGSGMKSVAYAYCTDDGAGGCADAFQTIDTSLTAAGNWAVTWSAPLPADGTYRIVAIPTDNANNVGDPSDATLITVDRAGATASAPGVSAAVTYGTDPTFVNDETVTFTSTAADGSGSGVQSVAYSYCTDDGAGGCAGSSTLIGSSTTSAGGFAVNWNTPLPSDATYRITAVATDNLGTAGDPSSATLVAVDKTPPAVSRPTVNGHS